MKKKIFIEELSTVIDASTGEVKEERKFQVNRVEKEPEFVKLYLRDVLHLATLPKGLNALLHCILQKMDYGNQVVLIKPIKEQIAEELEISLSVIDQYIHKLKESRIIVKKQDKDGKELRGIYTMNPYLFGKGEWKDIRAIRLQIDYDFDTNKRTVKTFKGVVQEESVHADPDGLETHTELFNE